MLPTGGDFQNGTKNQKSQTPAALQHLYAMPMIQLENVCLTNLRVKNNWREKCCHKVARKAQSD